ncbi:hypothetical protein L7F22_005195 [Adiantum nelumboides]|nr:hypothetical protein [Adiantum nelumboides]
MQQQNGEEAEQPPSPPQQQKQQPQEESRLKDGDAAERLPSPPQQQKQQQREEGALQSAFHASSKRGLLASIRRRENEDENNRGAAATLSILVPQHLTYNNLAASGTLQWKHILFSPVKTFHHIRNAREETSLQTPSSLTSSSHSSFREGLNLPLIGEVRWEDLSKSLKVWLRNPKNLALLVWGTAVGVSGAMLFLIMVGFLDHAMRRKSERDTWFEANNQILNALFTLMCLYLHPQRLLDLFLLYRWQPSDIKRLRDVYCKDGRYKPHEWSSMLVVVMLLNLNCFAQYALCGLNWGYRRSDRPALGVALCLAVAIGAPAAAGIYTILSPLGKDYVEDVEHLAEREETEKTLEKSLNNKPSVKIGRGWKKPSSLARDGTVVERTQWKGGLFDIRTDLQVTCFTLFCGFCVFGWNMERLGFGNRFVHIVTFILLCTAPYWIFFLAATNIDNSYVRHGLSYGGIVLCIFGLLYGGFWRIRMRRTYGLPAQTWCCGRAGLTDCIQWLFCSMCSLCQEVRTSEAYKIHNRKFYERYNSSLSSAILTPDGPSPVGQDFASTTLIVPSVEAFARKELSIIPEISEMPVENQVSCSPPPSGAMGSMSG